MAEVDVEGFPGYTVDTEGIVRSYKGRSTRQIGSVRYDGYVMVDFRKNGTTTKRYAHHVVLEAFVSPRPEGMEARHLDGDKSNNAIMNLEWSTHVDNCADRAKHGTQGRKFIPQQVREIRRRYRKGETQVALADEFGTHQPVISQMVLRKTYRNIE